MFFDNTIFQFIILIASSILFFFVMATVHELGHFIAGLIVGGKAKITVQGLTSTPLLTTQVTFEKDPNTIKNLFVTIAGVTFQLLLSLIFFWFPVHEIIRFLAMIYLPVIGINFMPKYPTDGFFVCSVLLKRSRILHRLAVIINWLCFVILYAIGWLFTTYLCWTSILTDDTVGIGLGLIGILILYRVLVKAFRLSKISDYGVKK